MFPTVERCIEISSRSIFIFRLTDRYSTMFLPYYHTELKHWKKKAPILILKEIWKKLHLA